LANSTTSGAIPNVSAAKGRPVRPKPVRLHDHGGDRVRRRIGAEEAIELLEGVVDVAVGRHVHRRQQRLVALLVRSLRGGEAGGSHRAPVERTPERDDPGLAGGPTSELDGAIDRLGPAVAEEHLWLAQEGRQPRDRLAGADVGLVLDHDRRVQEGIDLPVDRRHHVRVAMTRVGDRDA
jgi:hypothetical protein